MRYWRIALVAVLFLTLAFAKKKKNPDDITQVLELPKDPPMVAVAETSRLMFQVSPLSAKGLLSQQTRDALKAILKMNGGIPVVHIRAFVAGSGDLRRIPQIVSEVFTEKKMQLPSVSVVQAGGLPLEDAQVVLEAVSIAKKDVNPEGLMFVEGQTAATVEKSLDLVASRLAGAAAVSVTCFVSTMASSAPIAARFPSAAVDVVQTQRSPARNEASCEAVARGGATKILQLAFSGTQVAFGADDKAGALAFQRLEKSFADAGIQTAGVVMTNVYALSSRMGEMARKARRGPGAMSVTSVEGVASLDGSFAVDAIAAVSK
jgi:hypothetical protein